MYRDGFLCRICGLVMGETAEILATEYGISREEQDAYACESQRRAAAAQQAGCFKDEMVPVTVRDRAGEKLFGTDEHPRPETTMEALARLPAVFETGGSVTAGNSSGLVDGAAGVLLVSERFVRQAKLEPLARVVGLTSAGVDPVRMGIGPVPAVRRLLERTGLELDDIGLIELNEAFAAQVIAVDRDLGLDESRVNVLGGAIALGHPIGATGARIVVTLLHEMRRRQVRNGIATLCVSGGQGMAALFEAV
jgi:acetyl-CoA C-acetyltransferase